jgi:chlorite dismutase
MTLPDTTSQSDDKLHYTSYLIYRRADSGDRDAAAFTSSLSALIAEMTARGVTVRGCYDVSGMRADADLMFWLVGSSAESLQQAARDLRRIAGVFGLVPRWSVMGLARESEFNKSHIPAFVEGKPAKRWLTVYPFVRSYEWYLLGDHERSSLLSEHGQLGRVYPDVLTNTVASFALNDYEWLVGIECDDLDRTVDMMRSLRASASRRHVRLEVPFFTGRKTEIADLAAVLQ